MEAPKLTAYTLKAPDFCSVHAGLVPHPLPLALKSKYGYLLARPVHW